jgi:hypothetical protein
MAVPFRIPTAIGAASATLWTKVSLSFKRVDMMVLGSTLKFDRLSNVSGKAHRKVREVSARQQFFQVLWAGGLRLPGSPCGRFFPTS